MKKLNYKGFTHSIALLAFVCVFAIAGVGYLVAGHAASRTTRINIVNHIALEVKIYGCPNKHNHWFMGEPIGEGKVVANKTGTSGLVLTCGHGSKHINIWSRKLDSHDKFHHDWIGVDIPGGKIHKFDIPHKN